MFIILIFISWIIYLKHELIKPPSSSVTKSINVFMLVPNNLY